MDTETLRGRLDRVIWEIEQARIAVSEHHIVKLVVSSKYADLESVVKLYGLGQRAFGENQVQQLSQRIEETKELPIEWHMIGRLQKNKINRLIEASPVLLQSLDSLDLAYALQKRLEAKSARMNALVQLNASKEETKQGFEPEEAVERYLQIQSECPNIVLKGVMTIGAHTDDQKVIQKGFESTRKVFDALQAHGARYCSMGMSNDFALAIRCGSNMIRVGSKLFFP